MGIFRITIRKTISQTESGPRTARKLTRVTTLLTLEREGG